MSAAGGDTRVCFSPPALRRAVRHNGNCKAPANRGERHRHHRRYADRRGGRRLWSSGQRDPGQIQNHRPCRRGDGLRRRISLARLFPDAGSLRAGRERHRVRPVGRNVSFDHRPAVRVLRHCRYPAGGRHGGRLRLYGQRRNCCSRRGTHLRKSVQGAQQQVGVAG
ncbi:hypothetical protein SDC9_195773 [bioreactor metagenome]|uniref:Uncharacterized protein n=1 Tax=bioreactor metagenome TaxID=1076179 RepID=A0A645IA84_9ZZZZ